MLVNLNGQFIPREQATLSITDSGFLYGDTLFETIKAHGKKILLLHEHLDRLELSARLLNFPFPRERIETALRQLADGLTDPITRIRLTLSRGDTTGFALPAPGNDWFLITATATAEPSMEERQAGAECVLAPNRRSNPLNHLPQMKRGNHADCLYAADYARGKGAREALFIDENRQILEGSSCNVFAFSDGTLVTPPLGELILGGIMRQQIFGAATELGIPVVERNLLLDEIFDADEAFLSNSMIDLMPIGSIDRRSLRRGKTWESLLETVRQRIGI